MGVGERERAEQGGAQRWRPLRGAHARWIAPRASTEEARRRELVLNAFLAGSLVLGLTATAAVAFGLTREGVSPAFAVNRIAMVGAWLALCAGLLSASRRGRLQIASLGLVTLYAGTCLVAVGVWSLLLPSALILAAILVVLIVVLLEGRSAALALAGFLGSLALLDALQLSGAVPVDDSWLDEPATVVDSLLSFALLGILAGVSLGLRRELGTPIGELVSHGAAASPLARLRTRDLTVREVEVTQLVAEGLQANGIAARLFISASTVNTHIGRALAKTGCANRTELAVLAIREGLAPLNPISSDPATAGDPRGAQQD